MNFYSWFSFKKRMCGDLQDAILLDEFLFETNGMFSENARLYPANFQNI